MGKKRKTVRTWRCFNCSTKVQQWTKPIKCKKCLLTGTYLFHGAKVVKK